MAFGLWEPYLRQHLLLDNGDVFVDIGAYIGYYTVYASRKVGQRGLVIAVEPDERNLTVLRRNVGSLANIQVFKAAAGYSEGQSYLKTDDIPAWNKIVTDDENGRLEKIRNLSLDSLINNIEPFVTGRNANVVIKIDVEGTELDVIRGGLTFIRKYAPTIFIETHKPAGIPVGNNQSALENILTELDYCFNDIYDAATIRILLCKAK